MGEGDWDEGLEVSPEELNRARKRLGVRGIAPGRGSGTSPETQVLVDGVHVHVGPTIKYLGLTLDSRWSFGPHFGNLAPRVRKAGLAVASLMRAQGGPGWMIRRLYVTAVLSIALYGAPIWAPSLLVCRRRKRSLRQALRPVLIRAIRGYLKISMACVQEENLCEQDQYGIYYMG
ncbi:uncharacterized protein LOC112590426 [Harpegnathos saltator]|uniref:uncharacterized protein LOC112590426 n=1 Tax=Harpegnathos saltator TaxID=610380 RepID=UPI000DBEE045|nr:uncharacterized protein LOC112590426 [Harpegnathos saltator]